MSYSVAEAKVAEVSQAVATAHERLRALRIEAERIGDRLDSSVENAQPIVDEIDANAGSDPLWDRLKARKDQIAEDLQAVSASASAIVTAIDQEIEGT